MTSDQLPASASAPVSERALAALVRSSYEADLRARIGDSLDRQLAVFLATQWVPSRSHARAA